MFQKFGVIFNKFFSRFLLPFLTDLQFAIFILGILGLTSSLGSVIEQEESLTFYQQNYPTAFPLYGFLDWRWIEFLGLDHLYTTPWFFFLLLWLICSLISCTFTRQFPLFFQAKKYKFQYEQFSFLNYPFFVIFPWFTSSHEIVLLELQKRFFSLYQKKQVLYGYQGLLGRVSPIFVHLSLLCILGGGGIGAFQQFKAQELVPKNELFQIQNPIQSGWFTCYPSFTVRVNDFWVDYLPKKDVQNERIHQFYSDLSILEKNGKEIFQQTISVNHPLHYQGIDIYQSDWNVIGFRFEKDHQRFELPLFPFPNATKNWITWFPNSSSSSFSEFSPTTLVVLDQLQQEVFLYNLKGEFQEKQTLGETFFRGWKGIEILPSTGLVIKYDPSLPLIYTGFGLLLSMTFFSYLPFTQLWIATPSSFQGLAWSWFGSSTNRGQIQLEIQFENFLRWYENQIGRHPFFFHSSFCFEKKDGKAQT